MTVLLYLAPALLLLACLVFGRYPGEGLLAAVGGSRHAARLAGKAAPARPLHGPRSFPRGGVLLALALAGRGPPRWAPATHPGWPSPRRTNERKR